MTNADLAAAQKFDLYQWHKTLGWLTLMLTLARLAARSLTVAPAPIPTIPPRTRALARAAHLALYALALTLGFSGWVRVSAALIPIPIELFGLANVPNIAAMNPDLSEAMGLTHKFTAYAFAGLVALHIAAALKHRFIDRDATLRRMSIARHRI